MVFRIIGIFLAGLCTVAGASAAPAEPDPDTREKTPQAALSAATQSGLTIDAALQRAFDQNPSLRAFGTAQSAQRARGELYTLSPPLSLALQLENFAGSGELNGFSAAETTLSLSGLLERGNKRQNRGSLAKAWLERLDAEELAARLDLGAEVARRYLEVVGFQALRELHEESVTISARALEVVKSRVAAGRAGRPDILRAELAMHRAMLEADATASSTEEARIALAGTWGAAQPDFGQLQGALLVLPETPPLATLANALQQNPELAVLASLSRIEEARERVAASARKVDLEWSVGFRRFEAGGDQGLVVGVSMPLGNRSRSAPALQEAKAQRATVHWQSEAVRNSLHNALSSAQVQLAQRRAEVGTLIKDSLPRARELLKLTEQGYAGGRYSMLELADAQQQLLDITARTIASATGFHSVLIEIQRLTSKPIVTDFLGN